ncbi:MAG: hypothetical protein JOY82_23675 [Streptosporangiaceae bacterium]|nr:hypothetical protein [Streptosporangiaceae bacterium]
MRHVIGVFLAVIMAGVLFFAGGWGYLRVLRLPAPAGSLSGLPAGGGSLLSNHAVLIAFGALLGTGLLAGILIAVPWISPLASGLPGLMLLAWTGLYLARVHRAVALIPLRNRAFGTGFEAMLIDGVLAAAGLAMIIPMFVPSRWRRKVQEPAGYQPYYGTSAPSGGSSVLLSSDWAETAPLERPPGESDDYGYH